MRRCGAGCVYLAKRRLEPLSDRCSFREIKILGKVRIGCLFCHLFHNYNFQRTDKFGGEQRSRRLGKVLVTACGSSRIPCSEYQHRAVIFLTDCTVCAASKEFLGPNSYENGVGPLQFSLLLQSCFMSCNL